MYLWRSVYWSEGVSMRTRLLLLVDWVKRGIWGRDLSKVSVFCLNRQLSVSDRFVYSALNWHKAPLRDAFIQEKRD